MLEDLRGLEPSDALLAATSHHVKPLIFALETNDMIKEARVWVSVQTIDGQFLFAEHVIKSSTAEVSESGGNLKE